MEEYVVTLRNKEDLDDFYNDMETPGGDLYIPDRAVDLQLRRPISRNTHYMLTPEEVIETIDIQENYHGFSKLLADLYMSEGVRDKGILKDIASFIKREYPNNQINWELVDGWLKR